MTFTLQASGCGGDHWQAVSVDASSLSEAVSQINQTSNSTGIVASQRQRLA